MASQDSGIEDVFVLEVCRVCENLQRGGEKLNIFSSALQ
jgi:hypothetical protein